MSSVQLPPPIPDRPRANPVDRDQIVKALTDAGVQGAMHPIVIKPGENATPFTFAANGCGGLVTNKREFDRFFREYLTEHRRANGLPVDKKSVDADIDRREAVVLRAGFDSLHQVFQHQATYFVDRPAEQSSRFLSQQQARDYLASERERRGNGGTANQWVINRFTAEVRLRRPLPAATRVPEPPED